MRFLLILCIVLSASLSAAETAAEKAGGPIDHKTLTLFKPYKLDLCIVSDEPLESMGGALSFIHEGQEFTICCKGCVKSFAKDPAAHHAKLATALKAQKEKPGQAEGAKLDHHKGHDQHKGHDHGH